MKNTLIWPCKSITSDRKQKLSKNILHRSRKKGPSVLVSHHLKAVPYFFLYCSVATQYTAIPRMNYEVLLLITITSGLKFTYVGTLTENSLQKWTMYFEQALKNRKTIFDCHFHNIITDMNLDVKNILKCYKQMKW